MDSALVTVPGRSGLWHAAALALWSPTAAYQPRPNQLYAVDRYIKSPGIVSTLIGWRTNSLFDHVEPLSRDGLHWTGAHAGTGVQQRPLDWAGSKLVREYRYARPITAAQYDARHKFIESKIATPYNYLDIVGLLINKRVGLSTKRLICSAFDLEVQWATGLQFMNTLPGWENLITPETLHQSLDNAGHCIYAYEAGKN